MACPLHLLQLLSDADHTVHEHPAVEFDLPFTRPAEKAATAPLPLEMGPAPDETAALEGQRGKFDLQSPGMGLRTGTENLENKRGPVDDLAFGGCLEVALLHRAETGIDDDDGRIIRSGHRGQPLDIAGAEEGAGARFVQRHRFGQHHLEADRLDKARRLLKHGVGAACHGHRADFRVDDEGCWCAQGLLFSDSGKGFVAYR